MSSDSEPAPTSSSLPTAAESGAPEAGLPSLPRTAELQRATISYPSESPSLAEVAASEATLGLPAVGAAESGGSGFGLPSPPRTIQPQQPTLASPAEAQTSPGARDLEPTAAAGDQPRNVSYLEGGSPCGSGSGRNLVVCIDGTSNQFSLKNTNVVELYSRLIKDDKQLTFYNSGIGTYAKPSWKSWSYRKQVIMNKLDLAFALRFEKIIISAYAWLVDQYQDGDRIFLFGFSRGAYQVRALAAMIDTVGLLHRGNNDQIAFAYELYAASGPPPSHSKICKTLGKCLGAVGNLVHHATGQVNTATKSVLAQMRSQVPGANKTDAFPRPRRHRHDIIDPSVDVQEQTVRFKETFSRTVKVHFVGAWDTVSSVGFIRDKTLPKTTDGMRFVCHFRHALALQEFRVKFLPEYVNGGEGPSGTAAPVHGQPHIKEVWFTGSHSDIGGGSAANTTLDKFGPALRWMSFEASLAGLRIKDGPRQWDPMDPSKSMSFVWRVMECLPIKRLSYKDKQSMTWLPHLCSNRKIQPGQLLHESVWSECHPFDLPGIKRELDAYLQGQALLVPPDVFWTTGRLLDDQKRQILKLLLSSEPGRQSLRDLNLQQYIDNTARLVFTERDSYPLHSEGILGDLRVLSDSYSYGSATVAGELRSLADVLKISSSGNYETFAFAFQGHDSTVSSVAFVAPNIIISGSWDGTLRVWDSRTGLTIGEPASGHRSDVNCIAVSPGRCLVASGSGDKTVRIWRLDAENRLGSQDEFEIGTEVLSLAFSPDGSCIASGAAYDFFQILNASGGDSVARADGKPDWLGSVAYSPDGTTVASVSAGNSVQLWRVHSQSGWKELQCTARAELSVLAVSISFSPDGLSLVTGCADHRVRIWSVNAETLKVERELVGHTGLVSSVAFSPSGKHIASGSEDSTVRVWEAETGKVVGVLKGHTSGVRSVAFSPDGTRIVSGSRDKTLRVWDRIPPPEVF